MDQTAHPPVARRLLALGRQSAVYGLGSIVARLASSVLLLPLYTTYLDPAEFGAVETLVALVAVAVTIAQLGMVNALFRFALERQGEERWAVVRTTLAFTTAVGVAVTAVGLLLTPVVAEPLLGPGNASLWILSCAGLLVSLLYEPATGLYRLEQRPERYLGVTVLNVTVTVAFVVIGLVVLDAGANGVVAGSYAGTLVALLVVVWDRRARLHGVLDRAVLGPMLRFGLPFMPSRLSLWALTFANRLLLLALASQAAVGVFAPAVRVGSLVALLVTAFQLAWPPFAYAIEDDGEARRVYRAVLTAWAAVALSVVVALALLRDPIMRFLGTAYLPGADAMALIALGFAFYGAYYVVGVSVGRVKRTGWNWVVTGIAAVVNVGLCVVLIPDHGVTGAAVAGAVAYALMWIVMTVRAEQLFPVRYEWTRLALLGGGALVVFALGDRLPDEGAAAVAGRFLVALVFPLGVAALSARTLRAVR